MQDTLGSALRHAALLAGERTDTFLRVLSFYEKAGVIADHFNTLRALTPGLLAAAGKFSEFCKTQLDARAIPGEFSSEFLAITGAISD